MKKNITPIKHPDCISSYFKLEIIPLIIITVSGIIYNIGMTAGPYFEGRLAQCLFDILQANKTFSDMVMLCITYLIIILIVQSSRYIKRFYVRRFANDTSRNMRHMLYNSLIHKKKTELENENIGNIMTKAISDVDACSEGMRKFTTEIFDTGVVLISYLVMLFMFDWRLTLISCIFTPIAYVIASFLKTHITQYNSEYKQCAGKLNNATLDRLSNIITYRVNGRDPYCETEYEKLLTEYERKSVHANIWENTMQPLYNIISMCGAIFIIYFGAKNINGTGWTNWDIAAFTTFMSCFAKMALKSSKAAKLFNAVQKAQVSWKRIKPLMNEYICTDTVSSVKPTDNITLDIHSLCFHYPNDNYIIKNLSIKAQSGSIIGITGPVASGKSTLGKLFLYEHPYDGSIKVNNRELSSLSDYERSQLISYMGHQPELMSDTLLENICLGKNCSEAINTPIDTDNLPVSQYSKKHKQSHINEYNLQSVLHFVNIVCMENEINDMPEKLLTLTGNGGVRLSGGQQARLALARTLYNMKDIIILDDPFSAVDKNTEIAIMNNLKSLCKNRIIILISHRLDIFPSFDQIIFLNNGNASIGSHKELMTTEPMYKTLYNEQLKGDDLDEH